ncbi:hypothetical protein ACHAXR_003371 [Thalassiosira sp. AJA248-18]
MARATYGLVIAIFFIVVTKYHVISSASPNVPPSASPSLFPSASSSSKADTDDDDSSVGASPPSRPAKSSSSVTFLYELYEHEMYNPQTDSWTSRRFTQSPITGGGGRDSTSLDPQTVSPPRNYLFEGEWKIDMASESRDGFGWEYYVGKYDGLGRRRRRWVRTLKRVSSLSSVGAAVSAKKSILDAKKRKATKKITKDKTKAAAAAAATYQPNLFRAIKDTYNFKGFSYSFYKSLLLARSMGAALRIPISANFDSYDKYLAAPYISCATYFGYPWVAATFLNASLPLEAIKWLVGGVIWKVQWGLAVVSAFIRGVIEAALWVIMWPWRVWRATVELMAKLASKFRFGPKMQEVEAMQTLINSTDEAVDEDATNNIIDSTEGTNITIETHIEMNNSSEYSKGNGEIPTVSATAVVDSPRGGATTDTAQVSTPRKKHLTLFGSEVPTFHRPTSLEYSSTVQERIGCAISWRVSQERGYEFRWNFVYTCLPTMLFWGQLEEERRRQVEVARQRFVGIWGKRNDPSSAKYVGTIKADKIGDKDSVRAESKSLPKNRSKPQSNILSSFLSDHSSTVGMSAGWPMPVEPFFNLNLMMSLSGFYYGWLLKYIRSLFVLPFPKPSLERKELNGEDAFISSTGNDDLSVSSEKLVSSALKKKLPVEKAVKFLESDSENGLVNLTSTGVDVTGL